MRAQISIFGNIQCSVLYRSRTFPYTTYGMTSIGRSGACEGAHTLINAGRWNRIGCSYIKCNLCTPASTLLGKKAEAFLFCFFCLFVIPVFSGLSSVWCRRHINIPALSSKSCIKLDESASDDNGWICQGVCEQACANLWFPYVYSNFLICFSEPPPPLKPRDVQ